MKLKMKYFTLLTLSTLLMAVGIYFFKFSNNFTFGGITGLAVLVAKTGLISASDFSFLANIFYCCWDWSYSEKNSPPKQHTVPYCCPSLCRLWNEFTL